MGCFVAWFVEGFLNYPEAFQCKFFLIIDWIVCRLYQIRFCGVLVWSIKTLARSNKMSTCEQVHIVSNDYYYYYTHGLRYALWKCLPEKKAVQAIILAWAQPGLLYAFNSVFWRVQHSLKWPKLGSTTELEAVFALCRWCLPHSHRNVIKFF